MDKPDKPDRPVTFRIGPVEVSLPYDVVRGFIAKHQQGPTAPGFDQTLKEESLKIERDILLQRLKEISDLLKESGQST